MKKLFKSIIALILVISNISGYGVTFFAQEPKEAKIVDTEMSTESSNSNLKEFYSEKEWEEVYRQGLFVIEYNTYQIKEGGPDPENSEPVYLGIDVYRIGGRSYSSTVTYQYSTLVGDSEMYPDSQGSIEFAPGEKKQTIKLRIENDDIRNGNQLLFLTLKECTMGTILNSQFASTSIKIVDDEEYIASKISMSIEKPIVDASEGGVKVSLKRDIDTEYVVFKISTEDGTAKAGEHYDKLEQEIAFERGVTSKVVTIPIIQTDAFYEEPKNFNIIISDFYGCEADDVESIRANITNKPADEAHKLTDVSDAKADTELSKDGALAQSSQSILNINDTIDRADLLRTAIGAANGSAIQKNTVEFKAMLAASEPKGEWKSTLVINKSQYKQLYTSASDWDHNSMYDDGNDNLLIATVASYDLNHFVSVNARYYNVNTFDLRGNPNTAFGYLTEGGPSDSNTFEFKTEDMFSENANMSWMRSRQFYVLQNRKCTNSDYLENGETFNFSDSNGNPLISSAGYDGSAQKLFYQIYDDEDWDDTNFEISDTTLTRAVMPFSYFDSVTGATDFEVDYNSSAPSKSKVKFVKDSYLWEISVDTSEGGGVGEVPNSGSDVKDKYGFYIGSNLTIELKNVSADNASAGIFPEYIYMIDEDGSIHNSAYASEKMKFSIKLETIMSKDITVLTEDYYMTNSEAKEHINNTLGEKECINQFFYEKLDFVVSYTRKQQVVFNFDSFNLLSTPMTLSDGSIESPDAQISRIEKALTAAISFEMVDGSTNMPNYSIDLDNNTMKFSHAEIAYITLDPTVLDPEYAETGKSSVHFNSNLYDLEYMDFTEKKVISGDICGQIKNDVVFRIFDDTSSYLKPYINIGISSSAKKTDEGFEDVFVGTSLDEYLLFESLYHDTSETPDIVYYGYRLTISNIYAGTMTGEVKDFDVDVYYEDLNGTERQRLFTFTYHGGASVLEAENVNLTNLHEYFTHMDGKDNENVDAAAFKPVVKFLDYTTNGYSYILYIPTYYNYVNDGDSMYAYYSQIFKGGDGITLEMSDYNKESKSLRSTSVSESSDANDASNKDIIGFANVADSDFILPKTPTFKAESQAESLNSVYFEEQNKFYTYQDRMFSMSMMNFGLDTSTLLKGWSNHIYKKNNHHNKASALMSMFSGSLFPTVSFNEGVLSIKTKISVNLFDKTIQRQPAEDGNGINKVTSKTGLVDLFTQKGEPWSVDGASPKTITHKRRHNATITFALLVDIRLTYNELTKEMDFTGFSISGDFNVGYSYNLTVMTFLYVPLGISVGAGLSFGAKNVLDYVDKEGISHYELSWDGVGLSPRLFFLVGGGVGVPPLLAGALQCEVNLDLTLKFAKKDYVPKQQEVDFNSKYNDKDAFKVFKNSEIPMDIEHNDSWKVLKYDEVREDYETHVAVKEDNLLRSCQGKTLLVSDTVGDTISIVTQASSFQLMAMTSNKSGSVKIKIVNTEDRTIYVDDSVSLKKLSESGKDDSEDFEYSLYKMVFSWDLGDNSNSLEPVPIRITIENENGINYLDSFRIYNNKFEGKLVPAAFEAFNLKVAASIVFTVLGMEINFDPAKMQVKVTDDSWEFSIYLICAEWSKEEKYALRSAPVSDNLPVVKAEGVIEESLSKPDYIELGDYASERKLSLLKENISKTSNIQVLEYNEKIYTFYTVAARSEDGMQGFYRLEYSIDGVSMGAVSNELLVSNYHAYISKDGVLTIQMIVTDSTVERLEISGTDQILMHVTDKSEPVKLDNALKFEEIYKRMCVQTVTLNSEGAFNEPVILEGTDANGIYESLIVGAGNTLFFVEDSHTDVKADYDLLWNSIDNEISGTSDFVEDLINSHYTGMGSICYCVNSENGFGDIHKISLADLNEEWSKPGFRIVELEAIEISDNVYGIAYVIEIINSVKDGHPGVLKELHYREGILQEDGTISFGDAVVLESIFDFNEDLGLICDDYEKKYSSRYYDDESGEVYSNIILENLQFEKVIVGYNAAENKTAVLQPVLFYQTNSDISFVKYETLSAIMNGTKSDNKVELLYDGDFSDYVISVSDSGNMNLVYKDKSKTNNGAEALYICDYDPEFKIWNNPRQIIYSDVYDEEAFKNFEYTAKMFLDDFSAYLDNNGDVNIAFRSSYVPYTYDYYTNEDSALTDTEVDISDEYDEIEVIDGEVVGKIISPLLDPSSEYARNDIFAITFSGKETAVDVTEFEVTNPIFIENETVSADFLITNTGDTIIEDMYLELYYYNPVNNTTKTVIDEELSGIFLAGDIYRGNLTYDVDSGFIYNGSILGLRVTEGRRVLFDSLDDYKLNNDENPENDTNVTYYVIESLAELVFSDMYINVDSEGIMSYQIDIVNIGNVDVTEDVTLYFKLYSKEEGTSNEEYLNTLFSVTVDAEKLASNRIVNIIDKFDVSKYLSDSKMYYKIEMKTKTKQYDTKNDITDLLVEYQEPGIEVETVLRTGVPATRNSYIRDLVLGEEIVINANVVSDFFDISKLRVYEVGTNCLSIDDSSEDGIIRVKVTSLPNNNEGCVRIVLTVEGTKKYKVMYLHLSNREVTDFNESVLSKGWELSKPVHTYATNFDLIQSKTDGSTFTFGFLGEDLKIYGDYLSNGGEFLIKISDMEGNVVLEDIVSTYAEKDNVGMMLYNANNFSYDQYLVTITSILDKGEMLSLDKARYVIDNKNADVTPYAEIEHTEEALDAPLLLGRTREASFTVKFDQEVILKEGKALEDMVLEFNEFENDGDAFVPTGNVIKFNATELKGNKLTFKSNINSKAGYVLKYVLSNSNIPDDFLMTKQGEKVNTDIPNYNTVSYEVRESGIMSVKVVEDLEMPNGSVQKCINVKFMVEPEKSRLQGTSILYKTTDAKGVVKDVVFEYAGMTGDPRTAIYRASTLELDNDEISKLFAFEKGITLNEDNYVLITKDGDYLENDISTVVVDKTELDIEYAKLAPVKTQIAVNNDMLYVYVEYNQAVALGDSKSYVELIYDAKYSAEDISKGYSNIQNEIIKLYANEVINNSKTIVFSADMPELYDCEMTIRLQSTEIQYEGENCIINEYDGIIINPKLTEANALSYNTKAYIKEAKPCINGNDIEVKLYFNTLVKEETLIGSSLNVREEAIKYDINDTQGYEFIFDSCITEDERTVAIYRISENIGLDIDEKQTSFYVEKINLAQKIYSTEGLEILSSILTSTTLLIDRANAKNANISLVDNGNEGNQLKLDVTYDRPVEYNSTNIAHAFIRRESNGKEVVLQLSSEKAMGNTITFVTNSPFTLDGDSVTSFTIEDIIIDNLVVLKDENGIGVSRDIRGLDELVVDKTGVGVSKTVELILNKEKDGNILLEANVIFDQKIRDKSFNNSTITVNEYIKYADGRISISELKLDFVKIDDNVALYRCNVELIKDAEIISFTSKNSTINTNQTLFNENKTVYLSKNLPESIPLTIRTVKAVQSIISNINHELKINSLKDIVIYASYEDPLKAVNPDGVSLDVKVEGVKNIDTLSFELDSIIDSTLVFKLEENVEADLEHIVKLSLDEAFIKYKADSILTNENGVPVNVAIAPVSTIFTTEQGENLPVEPDKPDNTDAPESTEKPVNTDEPEATEKPENTNVPNATNKPESTKVPNATDAPESTKSPMDTDSDDVEASPDTGNEAFGTYIMLLAVSLASVITVIKARKRKGGE